VVAVSLVVDAVQKGEAEVGVVRTDTLERLARTGSIRLNDFKIINGQRSNGFPFLHSTRLYPEWAFAKMRGTPVDLAKKVVIQLLEMDAENPALHAADIGGWTIPLDYHPVHGLMQELRIGPYQDYGRITPGMLFRQYWYVIAGAIGALLLMAWVTLHVVRLNRTITASQHALERVRDGLENEVRQRTADLESRNTDLQKEVRERERIGEALRQSESRYRGLVEQSLTGIYIISEEKFQYVNPRMAQIFGYTPEEMLSAASTVPDIIAADASRELVAENIRKRITGEIESIQYAFQGRRKDGSIIDIEAYGARTEYNGKPAVIGTIIDITEKIQLEHAQRRIAEHLFREQKDQSISTLAGGVAHDFNNILMGLIGSAELLKMRVSTEGKEADLIKTIIDLSKRMAHLTRQLLAYSKQSIHEQNPLSLNQSVQDALALSHKGASASIDVCLDLADDLWPVYGDAGQLEQVAVNLLSNAFEAMDQDGSRLTVRTENIRKKAWECSLGNSHPEGEYVHLSISDNGPGVPREIRDRIFEPFFTTKFIGRGLGLAAVAGIIQSHQGCITVTSEPGSGATFDIFLPRHNALPEEERHERVAPATGSILLLEDEPQILTLLKLMIAELGYTTLAADNGDEAIRIFDRSPNSISLAILDIQMKGKSGKQVFRELRARRPGLKVLISSGYDEQTALSGIGPDKPDGFIHKPYWIDDLRTKIQEVLRKQEQ